MTIGEAIRWAESREEPDEQVSDTSLNELEDLILEAKNERGKTPITQAQVLAIPTVKGCLEFITNMICMLPIRLYERVDDDVIEITDDRRTTLLNNDTGDTLDPVQWKKAWIRDYFLGNGGFTYIHKYQYPLDIEDGTYRRDMDFAGIYYVDESRVSVNKNTDAIFKEFNLMVDGKTYYPWDFLIILRDTRDGCHNIPLTKENELLFSVAYQTLKFENHLLEKGGNKKGFIKSQKKLGKPAMDSLKNAFRKLYKNDSENVVVLNDGLDFKESSNTSVEMQLNENKETNAKEICKLFTVLPGVLDGNGSEEDFKNSFTMACMPVMNAMITAFNKGLLWESEKKNRFWAFDTAELLKGSIKDRYEAYKYGIDGGFLNIDEVRSKENMKPFGFDYINIGLNSVLYNPKTHEIYNTNADTKADMENLKGGELSESKGQE